MYALHMCIYIYDIYICVYTCIYIYTLTNMWLAGKPPVLEACKIIYESETFQITRWHLEEKLLVCS